MGEYNLQSTNHEIQIYIRYAVSVRWERNQRRLQQEGAAEENQPLCTFTIEDFNRYFCCCARRVGSMFFLVERKDGSPIVVAGPCWPFCTFVTVPLIVVLSGLVGYFIVSNPNTGLVSFFTFQKEGGSLHNVHLLHSRFIPTLILQLFCRAGQPWWFALIYYPIIAFVLTVLFCVSCRDPGLMERVTDEEAAENGWFWNEQVGSYRPAGAMYCRECKVSVTTKQICFFIQCEYNGLTHG